MPGHIGTPIGRNSADVLGQGGEALPADLVEKFEKGGVRPEEAARVILEGVKAGKWRILVGKDAEYIDAEVRRNPEAAYEPETLKSISDKGYFIQL